MAGTKTDDRKSGDTSRRGFASMDEDKQREIASKGGQSVKPEDRSFAKDPELAAEAGRKGGENSHGGSASDDDRGSQRARSNDDSAKGGSGRGGNFAQDREKASEAGRKGGRS
jgi:uncharacterized protein